MRSIIWVERPRTLSPQHLCDEPPSLELGLVCRAGTQPPSALVCPVRTSCCRRVGIQATEPPAVRGLTARLSADAHRVIGRSTTRCTTRHTEAYRGVEGLNRVVQRATARGFGASPQPVSPTPQPESWVEGGFRFTRLESGHLVKDPLTTAPLR